MVDCISATNGIAIEGNPTGGPVCQGNVTLQLAAGGSIQGSTGPSLSIGPVLRKLLQAAKCPISFSWDMSIYFDC